MNNKYSVSEILGKLQPGEGPKRGPNQSVAQILWRGKIGHFPGAGQKCSDRGQKARGGVGGLKIS